MPVSARGMIPSLTHWASDSAALDSAALAIHHALDSAALDPSALGIHNALDSAASDSTAVDSAAFLRRTL